MFLIALTIMSANMAGDPRITRDHVVYERHADYGTCLARMQAHMTTKLRPGHIWSGTQPHPTGKFAQCEAE